MTAFTIFNVCEALHGHNCGSGETLLGYEYRSLRNWLESRLASWRPSRPDTATYDAGVLMLITGTLSECAERDARIVE